MAQPADAEKIATEADDADGGIEVGEDDALEMAISELQDVVDKEREHASNSLSRTLREIPLEVQAVIGRASISVAELNALQEGSTVELNSKVGDPIDIIVNGVKVATGQMQVSEEDPDRFAFAVTKVYT